MRSFKVGIKTSGDDAWIYNGLRFPTKEKAEEYGKELSSRWFAVKSWEVHESEDE